MRICIFEDTYAANLSPLNYFRHTSELITGCLTLSEKVQHQFPKVKITLHSRKFLQNYLKEKYPAVSINFIENNEYLFLNSRMLFEKKFLNEVLKQTKKRKNFLVLIRDTPAAFYAGSDSLPAIRQLVEPMSEDNVFSFDKISELNLEKITLESSALNILDYPFDLIKFHETEIRKDLDLLFSKIKKTNRRIKGVDLISRKDVYLSPGSSISPNVAIDGSKGKVFISKSSKVEPFSYIEGPVFIGGNCLIKSGTKIYGPVCIRSNSKVSGEISNSIIHSYVNKQHLGFLGHSYLCEWVNLGAGTTTSNLKNNYSEIPVKFGGQDLKTGTIFLGSLVGDHTKTGINTLLNTGSIIGVCCNLFGSGFMPKLIRSFSWLDSDKRSTYLYEFDKALNTARISMQRRDLNTSKSYEELFYSVFKKTQENLL